MEWSRPWEDSPRPNRGGGGAYRWRRGSFYSPTSLHVAPDRVGERGWKNGGVKTRSRLHNRLDARIFAARAIGATRASLHASMLARPYLAHAGGGRRAYAFDARTAWPTQASLGRTQGGRREHLLDARKEADARIFWTRVSLVVLLHMGM